MLSGLDAVDSGVVLHLSKRAGYEGLQRVSLWQSLPWQWELRLRTRLRAGGFRSDGRPHAGSIQVE
ncbi:hypothetical protein CUJ84_Chr003535 [Rhizobium leguminosarum]|uniref:Uncharacterized protein n=1 Tax=Rhizobium leguminosarum TaxID=384 RepID=A0A2K9Z6Z4_RHILE|nr:hypothetical protein CUJ84_Chr003535 [Rhizobium leguminosarum]